MLSTAIPPSGVAGSTGRATGPPANGGCRLRFHGSSSRCGSGCVTAQQTLKPPENPACSGLRWGSRLSGCCRRRGRLVKIHGRNGRRSCRQPRCDRRGLNRRLLVANSSWLCHRRRRWHQITKLLVLGQLDLIVSHAPDRVFRCLDILVGNNDELDLTLVLQRSEPLPLLVEEVSGNL